MKLPDLRRKLPAPPVAPRGLPGIPPGLRWVSGEAAVVKGDAPRPLLAPLGEAEAAAGEPAGLGSGDADWWRLRKPAAGAHAAGTSRFLCIGECIESCE